MKKNILSFMLVLILCISCVVCVPSGALAQTSKEVNISDEEILYFLNSLASTEDAESFITLINDNSQLIENLNQYEYYMGDEEIQLETAQIFLYGDLIFDALDDFREAFEINVNLARINISSFKEYEELIYELAGEFNLDHEIVYFKKLSRSNQNKVLKNLSSNAPFKSIYDFADELKNCVDEMENDSGASRPSGGGSSGGGRGVSGIKSYVLTSAGEVIDEEPELNAAVKLVIQATLCVEPKVTYAIAVYGEDGKMKSVNLFDSKATEMYQHEFFEIDTFYNPTDIIRIFTLDANQPVKPLRKDATTDFYTYGTHLPVAEPETDGITAYKGYVDFIDANNILLECYKIRTFGYWSNVCIDERLTIECSNYDVWFFNLFGDPVYNLKNTDGKHVLTDIDIDTNVELITFTSANAMTTGSSVIININNTKTEYFIDSATEFYVNTNYYTEIDSEYFANPDALYTIAVSEDGKIMAASSKYSEYKMDKVISKWSDSFEILYGGTYYFEHITVTGDTPESGDVVEISSYASADNIKVIEPVLGSICENGITIDGDLYEICCSPDENFAVGESCLAYIHPGSKRVGYVEKAYENKSFVMIRRAEHNEDGSVSLITSDGSIEITGGAVLNGMYLTPEAIAYSVLYELEYTHAIPAYHEKGTNTDIIDLFGEISFSGNAIYRKTPDILGNYILTDSTRMYVATENVVSEFEKSSLMDSSYYTVCIYSKDGLKADIAVFEKENLLESQTDIILAEIDNTESEYELVGYSNGETFRFITNNDLAKSMRIGDYIRISHIGDEVTNIAILIPIYEYVMEDRDYISGNSYSPQTLFFGKINRITDEAVVMNINAFNYINRINASICVYVYDIAENSVVLKDTSEFSSLLASSDRVFIRAGYSVADIAMIVKY